MRYAAVLVAALASVAVAQNQEDPEPAAVIYDNPAGAEYKATFDSPNVKGYLTFTAGAGGKGVDIKVELQGLAGEPGPYGYHIHDQPVPADGNCTGTKAHLDPYGRGQVTPCDTTDLSSCEVGDLAGKYGKIPDASQGAITYSKSYTDLYASTKEGIGAFLGNRSIVIHRADTTRLACTDIELVTPTTPDTPDIPGYISGVASPVVSGYPIAGNATNATSPAVPAEPSTAQFTGSAATFGMSSVAALGGLLAVVLAL